MNFVIIGSPRTGSTHLTHLLNLQKNIVCHGEIFRSRSGRVSIRWDREEKGSEVISTLAELRQRDPKAFLDRILAQNYGDASVGFKIFSGQNDAILDVLIADGEIKKVVLMRRNVLAVYSSALIARETGTHKLKSSSRRPESTPTVLFVERHFKRYCTRYLGFYRRIFERLNGERQVFHLVNYDQINDPWHFASLVTFIGADSVIVQTETKLAKQNPSDILLRFSNPDVVDKYLRSNGLSGWLYESETSLNPFDDSYNPKELQDSEDEP